MSVEEGHERRVDAPRRILVAEDHRDSREAIVALLEAVGYLVSVAENGREAVERATAELPDLVLMDVMMPEIDGFDATRRLRADERTRYLPIIAVTAMEGAREGVLAAGADDCIPKPVDTRLLLGRIRAVLERAAPGGA